MRAVPGSMTYRMPGTVSEVSATLVASTTRRLAMVRLAGTSKTRCCSALLSREYSGSTSVFGRPARASAVSRISCSPERKTRMSPGPSRSSSPIASVMAVADFDGVGAPGYLDDRGRLPGLGVLEVPGEALGVDRRGGDDHLEVGA